MQQSKTFDPFQSFLRLTPVDRTRRNHGLEHATITLLSQKIRGLAMAGRSTPQGFYLYGKVSTDAVAAAVDEALRRMKAGEVELAVHPNCGTNFVTKGIVAGLAGYFGFLGANTLRSRWNRLPFVAVLATLAMVFAQPLGTLIQRDVTTSADMRDLRVVNIKRSERGGIVTHFVSTAG